MQHFVISSKKIGSQNPVFIIAEAGANWKISQNMKQNKEQAFRLIDIAIKAKADAVKFQLYSAKKLYNDNAGYADYLDKKQNIYSIIQNMELPHEWLPAMKKYCDQHKIIFLCTPFDEGSADLLKKIDMQAYKIASYEIDHYPLIKRIALFKKPMILSTGASNKTDINKTIKFIQSCGNKQIGLMQCTAKYPAPLSTLNLRVIPRLINQYNCPVGLSDHSREPYIGPLGAVALGASIIEKHYTTDNNLPGPDHRFAILGHELIELVKQIRQMEEALGENNKNLLNEEKELYRFCRRKIYAIKNIKKGEKFSSENIAILRPGKSQKVNALIPTEWDNIINKYASQNISKNEPIIKKYVINN